MGTARIFIQIADQDFVIEVDYKITYRGCGTTWDYPSEPPEWETEPPKLYRDWKVDDLTVAANRRNTPLEIPQWLLDVLNEGDWLNEQVAEHIYDDEPDEPEYERDDHRDRYGSGDD